MSCNNIHEENAQAGFHKYFAKILFGEIILIAILATFLTTSIAIGGIVF